VYVGASVGSGKPVGSGASVRVARTRGVGVASLASHATNASAANIINAINTGRTCISFLPLIESAPIIIENAGLTNYLDFRISIFDFRFAKSKIKNRKSEIPV
jgi:hypothetical protein